MRRIDDQKAPGTWMKYDKALLFVIIITAAMLCLGATILTVGAIEGCAPVMEVM